MSTDPVMQEVIDSLEEAGVLKKAKRRPVKKPLSVPEIDMSNVRGLLSDKEIMHLAVNCGMIRPFRPKNVKADHRGRVLSYGVSCAGYDVTLGYSFKAPKITRDEDGNIIPLDPKKTNSINWNVIDLDPKKPDVHYILQPGEHILGHTVERFAMPENVLSICLGKSTYARLGVIINVTPLEPGWKGEVTLEIHNSGICPVKIYPGEGICQFLFLATNEIGETYADKKGKYQNQTGVVLPKI